VSPLKLLLTLSVAFVVAQGMRVESTPYATVTDERLPASGRG